MIGQIDAANASPDVTTITLASGCTYVFDAPGMVTTGDPGRFWWYGPSALPAIASPIIIQGNGATIARSDAPGTPAFRLFFVGAPNSGAATPAFGYSSNERGSTFECRLDGGGWFPCADTPPDPAAAWAAEYATDLLADGVHTFEVRANNSLTKLGVNGTVCLYTHAATDVVLDVTGWIG